MTIRTTIARSLVLFLTIAGLAVFFAPNAVAQLNRIAARQIACTAGTIVSGSSTGQSSCTNTLSLNAGAVDATHPVSLIFTGTGQQNFTFWNQSTGASAYADFTVKADTARLTISLEGKNSSDAFGKERGQIYSATGSGTASTDGIDLVSCEGATPTGCFTRFGTNGLSTATVRATIDVNGLTLNNGTSLQSTATTGLAVANVGANSCGTTAATIAGSNLINVITVGATSGTQCRIAFSFAATTEWDCVAVDSTTASGVTKTTPVDTTHTDIIGTFTAGDKLTSMCIAR